MDNSKIKVRAGQIWKNNIDGREVIIENVRSGRSNYSDRDASHIKDGEEISFGALTADDYPDMWVHWTLHKDVEPSHSTVSIPATNESSLIDFFKAVPEGHCPCNILKSQCDFHK